MQALVRTAQQAGYVPELLQAVEAVNQFQKQRLHGLISQHFGGAKDLAGRRFALWGLALKPNTDDMRDAPSRQLLEALWADGASVAAYDPKAAEEAERLYPEALADGRLILAATKEEATEGADALVICTEWKRFMAPNFNQLVAALRHKLIFDGRNLYDPERLAELGWTYYPIGRGGFCAGVGVRSWCPPGGDGGARAHPPQALGLKTRETTETLHGSTGVLWGYRDGEGWPVSVGGL